MDSLLQAIQASGDSNAVHGALRVLSGLVHDLSDQYFPLIAPKLEPLIFTLASNQNVVCLIVS